MRRVAMKILDPPDTIRDHLIFANVSQALHKEIHSPLRQIVKYDWVEDADLECCVKNAERICLDESTRLEKCVTISHIHREFGLIELNGRLDAETSETVYEFKCTGTLDFSHKLQLMVYAWMLKQIQPAYNRKFCLFNFFTGELLQMVYNEPVVNEIMDHLFHEKFTQKILLNDSEFVENALNGPLVITKADERSDDSSDGD